MPPTVTVAVPKPCCEAERFIELMIDAIHEAERLPVEEIETDFKTKSLVVRLQAGSELVVKRAKQRKRLNVQ